MRPLESRAAGTVTLVFTDIEGSTGLLERLGDGYATLIADHHRIVDGAAGRHGGTRIDAAGDGLFFSFPPRAVPSRPESRRSASSPRTPGPTVPTSAFGWASIPGSR